jgi:hypothetical protein
MKRLITNVGLYFLVIPATYVGIMLAIDSNPQWDWRGLITYFAFSAPVFPLVLIFVPSLTIAALAARRVGWPQRRTLAVLTGSLLALTGAVLYGKVVVVLICAAGGALYGALFRVPLDRARPGAMAPRANGS